MIFAGLTFRRVQLSRYTKAYYSSGTLRLVPLSALCSSSSYIFWIVSHPNWVPFNVSFLDPFGLELYKAAIIFLSYKLKRWAVITYCYITYNINLCRTFHDNFWKSVVPGEGGRGGGGGIVVGKYYNTGQERNNDYNYM